MLSLNGDWDLYYFPEEGALPETPQEMMLGCYPRITAAVPGNVELDLVRAGVEQDPFWGENLYAYRKYEFYQWWFLREFDVPPEYEGDRLSMRMDGVNTYADVFVNDALVGHCDNMFIEHSFDITRAVRCGEVNRIAVRIRSAANVARAFEYPALVSGGEHADDIVWQRKPPHCFGWDIMPRLPSAGLWRGVQVEVVPRTRITQAYYATLRLEQNCAVLLYKYRFETDAAMLEGFTVRVSGTCGESSFTAEQPALFVSGDGQIRVENPRLWWPRGYGDADLYAVTMELIRDGAVVDSRTECIGIRRLEVEHRPEAGERGQFLVKANGCPILCKGSNWVPLDALHSRDAARYTQALALFEEMGCNIVRCWGGNVYEDHAFFDLCDQLGIMVWQDFSMACAVYPQEEAFYRMIAREAKSVICKLRNHASILLWAGDNEVDERYSEMNLPTDANRYNAITREVLPNAVRMHDPYRLFLPSSPYIPAGVARYDVPEQHNWGARAYFKDDFYKHTNARFISECGYHGCPSPDSLAKYIPAHKLWPPQNSAWDTHNTDYLPNVPRGYNRNQLMADQVAILFGAVPEDLPTFSVLSQISQAEAKKFFVERTRLKKWKRTGIIWWNMLDGWPQISDAVVDYYFDRKLAFTWLKRVHEPVCLMMDELVDWGHDVVLGNDSRQSAQVRWSVEDGDTGEVLLAGETHSPANENVRLGNIRELAGTQRLYLLRWQIGGRQYANHYISGFPPYDAEKMLRWVEIIRALL